MKFLESSFAELVVSIVSLFIQFGLKVSPGNREEGTMSRINHNW
jgi:hypothetical protein